jgi:hypothetical protein
VRLSPPSTTKNGKKKRQDLVNGRSDFNETKKFGISKKNYIEQNKRTNNSNQIYVTPKLDKNDKLDEDRTEGSNGITKLNGQEDRYRDREDNVERGGIGSYCLTRLRPRTRPTIPGSSRQKHREKMNPK